MSKYRISSQLDQEIIVELIQDGKFTKVTLSKGITQISEKLTKKLEFLSNKGLLAIAEVPDPIKSPEVNKESNIDDKKSKNTRRKNKSVDEEPAELDPPIDDKIEFNEE